VHFIHTHSLIITSSSCFLFFFLHAFTIMRTPVHVQVVMTTGHSTRSNIKNSEKSSLALWLISRHLMQSMFGTLVVFSMFLFYMGRYLDESIRS